MKTREPFFVGFAMGFLIFAILGFIMYSTCPFFLTFDEFGELGWERKKEYYFEDGTPTPIIGSYGFISWALILMSIPLSAAFLLIAYPYIRTSPTKE